MSDRETLLKELQEQIDKGQETVPSAQQDLLGEIQGRLDQIEQSRGKSDFEIVTEEMMGNFYTQMAQTLALPAEGLNVGLREAGKLMADDVLKRGGIDLEYWLAPGRPTELLKEMMALTGVEFRDSNNLAARIGRHGSDAVVGMATALGAANRLARIAGDGWAKRMLREFGEFVSKHPLQFITQEVGALAGGAAGAELYGPLGGFAGAVGGATVGDVGFRAITTPIRFAGKVASTVGRDVVDALGGDGKSLIRSDADPNVAKEFAARQIAGDLLELEDAMRAPLLSLAPTAEPDDLAGAIIKGMKDVRKMARKKESAMWAALPARRHVDTTDLRSFASNMHREGMATNPDTIPSHVDDILRLTAPKKGLGRPRMLQVRRLLGLRTQIGKAMAEELAKGSLGDAGLIRNYTLLTNQIEKQLQTAMPDFKVKIKQAREFSRQFNDIFRRGPLGALERATNDRSGRQTRRQMVLAFLRRDGSYEALEAAVRQSETGSPDLVAEMDDFVRSVVKDEAEQLFLNSGLDTVQAAQRASTWIRNHEDELRQAGELGAELRHAATQMTEALARKSEIEKSALAKYSEVDPDVSIRQLFSSNNPTRDAREIMKGLEVDENAVNGFQSEIIRGILTRSNRDPVAFYNMLHQGPMRRLISEVFPPKKIKRLYAIAEKAKDAATRGPGLSPFRWLGSIIFRIGGAQVGQRVAKATGGGTVQTPAIMSTAFSGMFNNIFRTVQPNKLLERAVHDRRWERVLNLAAPTTALEMKRVANRTRRTIGLSHGTIFAIEASKGDKEK